MTNRTGEFQRELACIADSKDKGCIAIEGLPCLSTHRFHTASSGSQIYQVTVLQNSSEESLNKVPFSQNPSQLLSKQPFATENMTKSPIYKEYIYQE